MSSIPPTVGSHAEIEPLSAAEESRLDTAMRKADQIMVASLKDDERRRARRRRILLLLLSGGLIMIAAGIVIAISLLAGEPAEQDIAKAQDLSGQGWQLWQQRDLGGAESKFEQAVKLNPKLTAAWNGLGWSELNAGK